MPPPDGPTAQLLPLVPITQSAMIALAANGLAGQREQASRWRQKVRQLKPTAKAAEYFAAFPTRDTASRVRITAQLRQHEV